MGTSFPLSQTRCYQQAARLMAKGASLSVALRGCMHAQGSGSTTVDRGLNHTEKVQKASDAPTSTPSPSEIHRSS